VNVVHTLRAHWVSILNQTQKYLFDYFDDIDEYVYLPAGHELFDRGNGYGR
jgi:hypothetical protein